MLACKPPRLEARCCNTLRATRTSCSKWTQKDTSRRKQKPHSADPTSGAQTFLGASLWQVNAAVHSAELPTQTYGTGTHTWHLAYHEASNHQARASHCNVLIPMETKAWETLGQSDCNMPPSFALSHPAGSARSPHRTSAHSGEANFPPSITLWLPRGGQTVRSYTRTHYTFPGEAARKAAPGHA